MAASAQVTVAATATRLDNAPSIRVGLSGSPSAEVLIIKNTHATDALFLGGSNVTTGNGFSLAAGASIEVRRDSELYGIRGANAITAHVLAH
jgi:hypothetical protein